MLVENHGGGDVSAAEFMWSDDLDARGDFEIRSGTIWHLYDGAFYIGGFVRLENAQRAADRITAQLDEHDANPRIPGHQQADLSTGERQKCINSL